MTETIDNELPATLPPALLAKAGTDRARELLDQHDRTSNPDEHEAVHDEMYVYLGRLTHADTEHEFLDAVRRSKEKA